MTTRTCPDCGKEFDSGEHGTNCPCYSNIKKLGRAQWICSKCNRDLSLEIVVAYQGGIDLLRDNK
jgi:DNA-directed RNA polymerase subunit RPC12/RpoP